ncbi:MAG TPA: PHP domain-containing protein, partial [Candidatus Limnocylindrales bacterium]
TARETIAEVREQGGLVGIPHPFDRYRGSMLKDPRLETMGELVDWVEAHNARVVGGTGNERAAAFARDLGLPGIAVSDAHSALEVGVAYTILDGDPSTPAGLLAALAGLDAGLKPGPEAGPDAGRDADRLVRGRATYFVRVVTPVAKLVNRARGNGRVTPVPAGEAGRAE